MTYAGEGRYVAKIKFSCLRPRDGSFAGGKIFGGSESSGTSGNEPCTGSEYAVGLNINYGTHVNGAGLICGAFESEPPATEVLMMPSKIISKAEDAGDAGNAANASNAAQPHYRVLGKRRPAACMSGYVWREARSTDLVCVTPESRTLVAQENAVASTRVDPNGAYGPSSCISGFVWREAFDGDLVCVTPERRDAVREENRVGPSRKQQ